MRAGRIGETLRDADRTSVAEAAKKNKISEQTIYIGRKYFAEPAPNDVRRLTALERENVKLKRCSLSAILRST